MEVAILGGFAALGLILAVAVITARRSMFAARATADALRKQVRFSSDVFDSLPIGLAMRDLQGRYVFVNRAWERFVGARREDVIGKTIYDRASGVDADAVSAEDREALARGPGNPTELEDFVYRDKRYMLQRTVIADAAGAPMGVLVASIDTTERRATEEKLEAEQRRLALVVRAAHLGIVDWDGVKRTAWYSERFKEILRHPPQADTSGWDYFEMIHPDDRDKVRKRFRRHIVKDRKEDLHETIEYRLRRADGGYVWIAGEGASVRDANGFAVRFIGSIEDISERRAQEETLRSAVRLRDEVERMSRHDLKTPLNSVIAMTRLLREGGKLAPQDESLLASIERAGYRILNMVNLSLDLFRMEQGMYEFRPKPTDLAAIARRVAADLESQAASKAVTVQVRTGNSSTAYGEELLCYSMLANLVKNAIEAAPDGGVVAVILVADASDLLIHVHNAGTVPEELRQRFFQKYATAGKSGGLGLGAYSARLMARVQQGEIEMRSSEEEGTTVIVRLGLATKLAHAPETPAAARRVLVVDDDELNRALLRRSLPTPPFEVEDVVNGRAALEAAKRAWPEAVLLDLEMPVMDGYEAAKRLREMERADGRPRCTIVAISSNDDQAIVQKALAAGCDHYLQKPAERTALLQLLGKRGQDPFFGAARGSPKKGS